MCICYISSSPARRGLSSAGPEADQLVDAATDADAERLRDILDVSTHLRSSPLKRATKSSSKSKKRSADRKRKGSSWYNVRPLEMFLLIF